MVCLLKDGLMKFFRCQAELFVVGVKICLCKEDVNDWLIFAGLFVRARAVACRELSQGAGSEKYIKRQKNQKKFLKVKKKKLRKSFRGILEFKKTGIFFEKFLGFKKIEGKNKEKFLNQTF